MADTSTTIVLGQTDPLTLDSRDSKHAVINKLVKHFRGANSGAKRFTSLQVFPDGSAPVTAAAHVKLVSCAAAQVIEVNGVPFTALSGTATVANNEFDMSSTDAVDASKLSAAINNSTHASISGVLKAIYPLKQILTPSTAIAGNKFSVTLADGIVHTFRGVAGAAVAGSATFSIDTSDAATCTDIVAQIAGYAPFSGKIAAQDGTTIVTLYSLDGQLFTLVGTATTLAESAGSVVTISGLQKSTLANAVAVKTLGLVATTTGTVASAVATNTLVLNGATLTGIVQNASGTITPNAAVAGNTVTIGTTVFTGTAGAVTLGAATFSIDTSDAATCTSLAAQVNAWTPFAGYITATATTTVVTLRAVTAGTAGNSIVLASTATRLAKSGTAFAGGIAVANDQFAVEAGATDTQVATDIARCINASTTTAVKDFVRATSRAAVVHLWSKIPGELGNGITASSSGGTITVAAARLAGATTAAHEGVQATGTLTLTSWLNTETVAVNGVTITAHTNTQANNQVDISGSDTADAANLALAINNSTTAALANVIATSSTNVVTVKARRGGPQGHLITLASAQASVVANVARLASATTPTTAVLYGNDLVRSTTNVQNFTSGAGGNATPTLISL